MDYLSISNSGLCPRLLCISGADMDLSSAWSVGINREIPCWVSRSAGGLRQCERVKRRKICICFACNKQLYSSLRVSLFWTPNAPLALYTKYAPSLMRSSLPTQVSLQLKQQLCCTTKVAAHISKERSSPSFTRVTTQYLSRTVLLVQAWSLALTNNDVIETFFLDFWILVLVTIA